MGKAYTLTFREDTYAALNSIVGKNNFENILKDSSLYENRSKSLRNMAIGIALIAGGFFIPNFIVCASILSLGSLMTTYNYFQYRQVKKQIEDKEGKKIIDCAKLQAFQEGVDDGVIVTLEDATGPLSRRESDLIELINGNTHPHQA